MLTNRFLSKNKLNEAKIGVNMEQHDIFLAIWVIGNINKRLVEVSEASNFFPNGFGELLYLI